MSAAEASGDDARVLLELLGGRVRAQALSTLAALGVADRLREGPREGAALAAELGCDRGTLESLLGLATALGFFASPQPGTWALTARGTTLCADALGPLAAFLGSPEPWDPWARLRETMCASGTPTPFAATFGTDLYAHLAHHPEAAERYDQAIDAFTRAEARLLVAHGAALGLDGAHRVLDLGGGRGTLLVELLRRFPELTGTLLDRPDVIERARPALPPELADRLTCLAGDFHEEVPAGHDRIVLRHVLHNWDAPRAAALLARCAAALAPGGRLLVVETLLTPDARADAARLLDLEMRVLTGGFVRRRPELRRLLQEAGLRVGTHLPLGPCEAVVAERNGT